MLWGQVLIVSRIFLSFFIMTQCWVIINRKDHFAFVLSPYYIYCFESSSCQDFENLFYTKFSRPCLLSEIVI